jgi:hypothetical protein
MISKLKLSLVLTPGLAMQIAVPAVFADAQAPQAVPANSVQTTGAIAPNAAAANVQSSKPAPLQGSVQASLKESNLALRDLGVSSHKLKKACSDLAAEMQRYGTTLQTIGPDAVGMMVIPSIDIPVPDTNNPLPPRKKWVDFYVAQIGQLVSLIQSDLQEIVIPQEAQSELGDALSQLQQADWPINNEYQDVVNLTKGDSYNQNQIVKEANDIQDQGAKMQKMADQLRHRLHSKHWK